MKNIALTFTILLFCISCSPQKRSETYFSTKNSNYKIHNDFKKYFDACGVEGTFVIFDKNNQEWILSDTLNIKTESLPSSTFKIINLLIALETKTIKDEKEITKKIFYDLGFLKSNDESSEKGNFLFNSIDHIPIVVNDLEKVIDIFKNQFHFTIKEGKVHEGVKNCFVKFQDGTYLEFIEPTDDSQPIGKYYTNFLKTRQGGTSMAISIKNTDLAKKMLSEKNIPFSADSNKIWQTIEPENSDLFFIEYADKKWKDNPNITTHLNTATSLNSTYFLCDDINEETKTFKNLGFTETKNGKYSENPYILFKVGQSNLYLIDSENSIKINQFFNSKKMKGICGFEIKVNSLQIFNRQIKQNDNIKYENNKTIISFNDYNIFMIFTE